ncbi:hypothetical protein T265_11683 [Opisthorchis viverrini]|uniref:Uncharacterized protein n=1 Tax=Opisthorchis viverrini TaxID=6198 RepID=A0A074YXR6_OPIVI|nr:hypothetical protein T265_11683 [Opisthorchis viverrini]KER19591.1 hypothetical protein T265_11683 [Opisthorchis viverrini]
MIIRLAMPEIENRALFMENTSREQNYITGIFGVYKLNTDLLPNESSQRFISTNPPSVKSKEVLQSGPMNSATEFPFSGDAK